MGPFLGVPIVKLWGAGGTPALGGGRPGLFLLVYSKAQEGSSRKVRGASRPRRDDVGGAPPRSGSCLFHGMRLFFRDNTSGAS